MKKTKYQKILLIEANNQRRWIGNRVEQEVHIPPLGLLSVASYTRNFHPDIEIKIIETSLDTRTDKEYLEFLDSYRPDLVGIRSISFFLKEFKQIAKLTKQWKKVPVVAGGPIVSAKQHQLLSDVENVDILVIGEGEIPFLEIVEGYPLETIHGVLYRDGNHITGSVKAKIIDDLNKLTFPDHSLIDIGKYESQLSYAYNHRRQGIITTSRGCPFHCTYCNTFAGKKVRLQSSDKVFKDMRTLSEKHGVNDFYFLDDIFNLKEKRTIEIFKKIIEYGRDWKLYFVNGIRADLMTHELVDFMVEAGTIWVTYAVESGSPKVQKLIRKNLKLDKASDIINYTQEKDIAVNINTMYGFPEETPEDAQLTLDYLGDLHRPSLLPYHFGLRLYEGCEIINQAETAGWNISEFLAGNDQSYNSTPKATPTFPHGAMMDHIIQYHERFGMENPLNIQQSVNILKKIKYTEQEIIDMYSILQNRPISSINSISDIAN